MPSQPQSLQLEAQSRLLIKFSWQPPSDFGGVDLTLYTIYWDSGSGSADTSTFVSIGTKNPTEQLVFTQAASLSAGQDYQLYVIAHNSIGESEPSSVITIKAASEPSAPDTFTTVSQSTTAITISWAAPDNGGTAITDYQVDWDQGSSVASWTPLVTTTSGST